MNFAQIVKINDADRYKAAWTAREPARAKLMVLYAFNLEIARAPWASTEPMIAEMRLQWWRDTISGSAYGDVDGNPVAQAMMKTLQDMELPAEPYLELISERIFDLYDDPMESVAINEQFGNTDCQEPRTDSRT